MIVQSGLGGSGKLTLRAISEGLTDGEVVIDVTAAVARPAVPVIPNPPLVILSWRRSPITTERPDPNDKSGETDVNSWLSFHPGSWLSPFPKDGRFAIYRAQFTPRSGVQKNGGQIIFREVVGKAEVWIDGKLAGKKTDAEKKDVIVLCPSGAGERIVSVLVESVDPGSPAGLGGIVAVE